jgi:hypothetical protein
MSGPLYGNINQENRNYLKVLITKHFKPTALYAPGNLEIFKVGAPLIVSCSKESF